MSYFIDRDKLSKAGFFNISDQKKSNKEDDFLSLELSHRPTGTGGNTEIFSRRPMKNPIYTSKSFDSLMTGQQTLVLTGEIDSIDPDSLSIYRNGIVLRSSDYTFNQQRGVIDLTNPIKSTDDDIEVRYRYLPDPYLEDVLILPRFGMTDDKLLDLIPDKRDVFTISRLLKWNPELKKYTGSKAKCRHVWIDQSGLRAKLVTYEED